MLILPELNDFVAVIDHCAIKSIPISTKNLDSNFLKQKLRVYRHFPFNNSFNNHLRLRFCQFQTRFRFPGENPLTARLPGSGGGFDPIKSFNGLN